MISGQPCLLILRYYGFMESYSYYGKARGHIAEDGQREYSGLISGYEDVYIPWSNMLI